MRSCRTSAAMIAITASRNGPQLSKNCSVKERKPNIGGRELARELKKTYLNLKVMFVSGYAGHAASGEDLTFLDAVFLAKPFTMQMLAKIVRNALDRVPQ
jgi:FixJ family two-component response regulator